MRGSHLLDRAGHVQVERIGCHDVSQAGVSLITMVVRWCPMTRVCVWQPLRTVTPETSTVGTMGSAGVPPDALYLLRGHNKAVNCVAFVGQNLLATGCVLVGVRTGGSRRLIESPTSTGMQMAFLKSGTLSVAGLCSPWRPMKEAYWRFSVGGRTTS